MSFLRAALRGHAGPQSYEELTLLDAFKATVVAHLTNYRVEFSEADLVGERDGSYRQRYHHARVSGLGAPHGDGSCRCLVTKATCATGA